jgi:hypothetical protein
MSRQPTVVLSIGEASLADQSQPVPKQKNDRDDMIDVPLDFQRWPFLHEMLGDCRDSLVALDLDSNRVALDEQRIHKFWVVRAAVSATAAVSLAIVQIVVQHWYMVVLEAVAVTLAVVAFHKGKQSRVKWLTERHKAERCRLLKFASIIRPDPWTSEYSSQECPPELSGQTEDVKKMSYDNMKKWLDDDEVPSPPGRILPHDLKKLTKLRDYYREKRLKFQSDYFKGQAECDVSADEWWRNVPPLLFTISVCVVAVHVFFETVTYLIKLWRPNVQLPHWIEGILMVLIIFAALRQCRGRDSRGRTGRLFYCTRHRRVSRFRVAFEPLQV